MDTLPDEPWVHHYVHTALRDANPERRELALSVLSLGTPQVWAPVLFDYIKQEREPWLCRFARLVLDDYRQACMISP